MHKKYEISSKLGCVSSIVRKHHMDANKTQKEKSKWELHKNAGSYFEQIFEDIPHETAERPHTFHLKTMPVRRTRHMGHFLFGEAMDP